MSERAPRPEPLPEKFSFIETHQTEPRAFETSFGPGAFVCHQGPVVGGRKEQQDAIVLYSSPDEFKIAAIDGITVTAPGQPSQGKPASLFLAVKLKQSFETGSLDPSIAAETQATMQNFGWQEGGAVFAAVELPAQKVTWAGDCRVVVIYPDDTPPFTTIDEVDPEKRNRLRGQVGADVSTIPQQTIIHPPLRPGCKIVVMSDGAYKNIDLPVKLPLPGPPGSSVNDTTLEEPEEIRDAKVLKTLLKDYNTPLAAVTGLNQMIAENGYNIDNDTLAMLYVEKVPGQP